MREGVGWEEGGPSSSPFNTLPATGHSHTMQRVLSTMQFLWVLGQALVDGLTSWLLTFTRHHRAISDVLRAERYVLAEKLLRVRGTPSTVTALPILQSCPLCLRTTHPLTPCSRRAATEQSPLVCSEPHASCRKKRYTGMCWTSCTGVSLRPEKHPALHPGMVVEAPPSSVTPWVLKVPQTEELWIGYSHLSFSPHI